MILLKFFVGQSSGLQENIFRDAQLSDVVEQGARIDGFQFAAGQSQMFRGSDGVALDPQNMLVRVLVFGVNRQSQAFNGREIQISQMLLRKLQFFDMLLFFFGSRGGRRVVLVQHPAER